MYIYEPQAPLSLLMGTSHTRTDAHVYPKRSASPAPALTSTDIEVTFLPFPFTLTSTDNEVTCPCQLLPAHWLPWGAFPLPAVT